LLCFAAIRAGGLYQSVSRALRETAWPSVTSECRCRETRGVPYRPSLRSRARYSSSPLAPQSPPLIVELLSYCFAFRPSSAQMEHTNLKRLACSSIFALCSAKYLPYASFDFRPRRLLGVFELLVSFATPWQYRPCCFYIQLDRVEGLFSLLFTLI
jgi:hypothetical protein